MWSVLQDKRQTLKQDAPQPTFTTACSRQRWKLSAVLKSSVITVTDDFATQV